MSRWYCGTAPGGPQPAWSTTDGTIAATLCNVTMSPEAEEVLEDLPDVDRYPTSPAAAGSARTRTSARSRTRGTERSHRAKLANSSVPRNNFSELTSSRCLRRLVRRRVEQGRERKFGY